MSVFFILLVLLLVWYVCTTREPRFPWNPSSLSDSDCFSKRESKEPTVPCSDPPLFTTGNVFCEEESPRGKCYEKPRFPSLLCLYNRALTHVVQQSIHKIRQKQIKHQRPSCANHAQRQTLVVFEHIHDF